MSQQQINSFRERLQKEKTDLAGREGTKVGFSRTGPASINIVEALFALVEVQQREIDDLRAQFENNL